MHDLRRISTDAPWAHNIAMIQESPFAKGPHPCTQTFRVQKVTSDGHQYDLGLYLLQHSSYDSGRVSSEGAYVSLTLIALAVFSQVTDRQTLLVV